MRLLLLALAALVLALPAAALGAFPQDPPDDPDFRRAELDCASHSVNEEEYHLYSRLSACTPNATDPENAAGMSADAGWREVTPGRPDVTIAYVEGGINWHAGHWQDLVDQVFLNAGELPAPTTPVDDGRLRADDYADTPDANGNGAVDPEDVIVRFSDGRDDDRNGYTDDISGWDFYDDSNDPATVDRAYEHSDNQMRQAAAEADNALAGAGVCPRCTILPVKAGAEALDRTDDLAQAWLYAGDAGASVIVSVTADLGYSSFMSQAVERLWRKGVVMVEASNDFDSLDHQGGMFHPHVIPGNGLVSNTEGLPGASANALTTTFRARSGLTSFGTKNFTSVSTQGGSTSESTPTHGGGFGLVLSAGRALRPSLTGPEAVQVVRATASDVSGATNWPSKPGWDLQFGYGRPNLLKAMTAARAGDVPPVGWISSPDWYALYDPARARRVPVTGHVAAPRSSGYRWRLEWAPGAEPDDADFRSAGSGGGSKAFDGRLGTLDLSAVPRSVWARAMALSRTKTLETNERYAVTLRLRVTDAQGRVGEDRRAIAVHHDGSLLAGFPRRTGRGGPGGEAQPQLADLAGRGRQALVFGTADGVVHAIDAVTRRELPGWPRTTRRTAVTRAHRGIDPGHEPVLASAAVGDLDGDGRLSVVATSTTGRVYAWTARGRLRPGFPRALDRGVRRPPAPRPARPFHRDAVRGATAPPVLADLAGGRGLEIVQAGWDGHLHAWDARGRRVPGWPVRVRVPARLAPPQGSVRLDDAKLDTPPVVADLDGRGRPELVVRSQQFDTRGAGVQPFGTGYVFAYHADGRAVAGWPVGQRALAVYYGSGQEFITEGANVPSAADPDGDGRDEVAVGQLFSPTELLDGAGKVLATYGEVPASTLALLLDPAKVFASGLPAQDPAVGFTTSGAFGRVGGGRALTFAEPGSTIVSVVGALQLPGTGSPLRNVLRAHDARSGAERSGFPAVAQGLDFLGAPAIADVTGDGRAEVLEGGDSSVLHAFAADGSQAAGFPKFHTGWVLYAPSVGDVDGDGRNDVVVATREGYLMAWGTRGTAAGNREWWAYRHDERNSGRHGTDSRPPSPPGRVRIARGGQAVAFVARGSDWAAGRPAQVRVTARGAGGRVVGVRTVRPRRTGVTLRVPLPAGTRSVTVQARDKVGNRSPRIRREVR